MNLIQTAQKYATEKHAACNQRYDQHPYAFHLAMVAQAAEALSQEYDEQTRDYIIAAAWCHDLIEDARETYNDVKKVLGLEVAEIVYALTNEKGRTRAERANAKYYEGIKATPYATLVKICDRMANVRHSREQKSRMFGIYAQEYPDFKAKLYVKGQYEAAWQALEALFV
ncbi:MAG: HD domain-containing protein [Bacteroidota bacterium]